MVKKSVFIRSLSYIEPVIAIAMRKTLFTAILFLISAILNAQTVNELKMDANSADDLSVPQDATYYYLHMTLPDVEQYEASHGCRTLIIDIKLVSQSFSSLPEEKIQKNL